ncbi:hypothetical protein GSI_07511 [Ganoderma sinense ZZ0214-1]|uniref:Reverse transcriptase domain-containing protein n=1 Tax=Ganoderma sinense ZZ0214-1 TaxID=1077348 RepID=A0A2G8S991_9APHY|nr:hypothetical protein GSI_07511 [Ganoderma sinense ZZ0214-1]
MATDLIHDGQTLTDPESLWPAFNQTFHAATHRPVDHSILEDIEQLTPRDWPPFSSQELKDAIKNTTTSSAPGVDHIHWRHLKFFIDPKKNPKTADKILQGFRTLFNACIQYNVWPEEFRRAVTVIIPKPNKPDYSKIKAYRPIVLLSCTAKVAREAPGRSPPSTLSTSYKLTFGEDGTKAWSPPCWVFDIAQFFPSVNHGLLVNILRRYGFSPTFCAFIATTSLLGSHHFASAIQPPLTLNAPTSGSDRAPLSLPRSLPSTWPLSSMPYTAPPPYNPNSPYSFYVDDGNLVATSDSTETNCDIIRIVYTQLSQRLLRHGLLVEHDKDELIHFPPPTKKPKTPFAFEDVPLNLGTGPWSADHPLQPSTMIKHLGFLLDKKLSFREHIKHYASKGNVTALAYRMLGTSIRGLTAFQRRKLFISCIRPILTYGSPCLNTAMRWITGTFCYTPSGFLPIVSALEPLHAYLQKLRKRYLLRIHMLMDSHPIRSLFPNLYKRSYHSPYIRFYPTPSKPKIGVYQGGISSLDDAPCEPPQTSADGDISYFHDFPECTDSYNPLDDECRPGARIIDIFRNRITLELQHPPKSDSEILQKWIQTVLTPRIRATRDDPTRLHAFTDGSASSKGGKSSAGYILFHGVMNRHYELHI